MPSSPLYQYRSFIISAVVVALLGLLIVWQGLDQVAGYISVPFLLLFPRASLFVPIAIVLFSYLALRKWIGLAGLAFGAALVWLLAIGIPARVNPGIVSQDRELLANDKLPRQPIKLSGVIGVIRASRKYDTSDPLACDDLCLSLLYSGTASGVIMGKAKNSSADAARLWTMIKDRTPCVVGSKTESARWNLDTRAPRLRALMGECLRSQPASMVLADFIIKGEVIGDPAIAEDTRLLNPPVSGTRFSLWKKGPKGLALVGRETKLNQRKLQSPLHFTTGGGAFSGPYMVVARVPTEGSYQPDIGRFINLIDLKVEEPTPAQLRVRLDDWLNDSAVRDPEVTLELQDAARGLMRGKTLEPGDLARYRRLILDRDGNGAVIRSAIAEFPEAATFLLDAAITRIGSLPPASGYQRDIASALATFPPGTFAEPSPLFLKLLHDPARAGQMTALFPRLADDNANAGPLMMSLFRVDFQPDVKPDVKGAVAFAALHQLCRIGTPAASNLPEIERLVASDRELSSQLDGSFLWAITRLRLGKPATEIKAPHQHSKYWAETLKRSTTEADCID